MDLRLFVRVVSRFGVLVAAGAALGVVLALASTFTIGHGGVEFRRGTQYSARSELLITQQGFPWGRATAAGDVPGEEARKLGIQFADPTRFTSLAYLYATLITSDPVRALMLRGGPVDGKILADPVVQNSSVALPLVDVLAIDTSREKAVALNKRALSAFQRYLQTQQAANDVPKPDRVVVQTVVEPEKTSVYKAPSKTMPILVFLAVLLLTVGLAFVLENLRPRAREVSAEKATAPSAAAARRTA